MYLADVTTRDQRSDTESAGSVIRVQLGNTQLHMAHSTEERKSEHKDGRVSRYVEYRFWPPVILRQSLLPQLDHQRLGLKDKISLLIHPIPIIRISHLEIKVPDHL